MNGMVVGSQRISARVETNVDVKKGYNNGTVGHIAGGNCSGVSACISAGRDSGSVGCITDGSCIGTQTCQSAGRDSGRVGDITGGSR
mmetsp:Transcript_1047/g.2476  ORF Transcript_1047/g.2476 Transcript_1047/m.2476 type:complete len:87 (-) Transcript_1047:293-553(-)